MDDRTAAYALYSQIKRKIDHLIDGKPNALINAALSEIMVDVALSGQVGKSRADAMEMLGTTMTLASRQARQ
ncbi:hypothetical protein [Asticcacaulis sp.]|uniref:hypothetical protein n=1 Tax=Asticcacaulis sp. TaxID=1872648 RepID=UPI003F7C326B